MKLYILVGARPNFMKVAPIIRILEGGDYPDVEYKLIHTGQHYDFDMSKSFFDDLQLPKPDAYLNVGSDTHACQTAKAMRRFERFCLADMPDIVVVVGDVNSTLAGALVVTKLPPKLAHVEAGLRSFDRTMPEELNRIVVDSLSDYCFATTCRDARNLEREGIGIERIHLVGDVMIDTLLYYLPFAKYDGVPEEPYALLTLHRSGTVDDREVLSSMLKAMSKLVGDITIVFPMHPRTKNRIEQFGLGGYLKGCRVRRPVSYLESIGLMNRARLVMTDSGGMQVETSVLGIPCMTLRDSTEHEDTLSAGTNMLAGTDGDAILDKARSILGSDKDNRSYGFRRNAARNIMEILCGRR